MLLAMVANLDEGLDPTILLTVKMEKSLIILVHSGILTQWQSVFPLKPSKGNKVSRII
jgi:hypothetical protein